MSPKVSKLLLPFYFGSVSEDERLNVEREMLSDTEVLVDFLDLKRQIEAANILAAQPSLGLWEKIKPRTPAQKTAWISLSLGLAVAASFAALMMFRSGSRTFEIKQPNANHALFDSSSELPASSGVL